MRVFFAALMLALGPTAFDARAQEQAAAEADNGRRSIAELAPAAIPDAENAAAQLEAIARQLENWAGDEGRFSQTPLGMAYYDAADRGDPPTAEQAAEMRAIMDRYAELDAGLQRAAACSQFASRGDFTKEPHAFLEDLLTRIQRFRSVGRYLSWRMRLLSLDGQHDEAVRTGVQMLRLARLHHNEPSLVGYLVTLAVRHTAIRALYDALAGGTVSFEAHAALNAELGLVDGPEILVQIFRTERAYATSAEQAEQLGIARFFGAGMGTGASDYMDAVIAASAGPWDEFRKAARDGGKLGKPTGFGVMADNLTPAVVASVKAHGRDLACVRSLRVFNALRLFAKLKKREATGLEELDLPAEAMADPYSDGPLKAKLTEDGWLIYSVMTNEIDDGGDFREQLDYGVTPRGKRRAE